MATLLRGMPVQYEPKLTNRFFLEFPQELDIPSWLVQMTSRPKQDIESLEIPYFNTKSYVSSRYWWNTVDIEFVDAIGPSTSQKLMEWSRLHAESLTGRMGYAIGYKKDLILTSADPTGVAVEMWKLYECQLTNLDFGSNSYDGAELLKPKITVQPYYCELEY